MPHLTELLAETDAEVVEHAEVCIVGFARRRDGRALGERGRPHDRRPGPAPGRARARAPEAEYHRCRLVERSSSSRTCRCRSTAASGRERGAARRPATRCGHLPEGRRSRTRAVRAIDGVEIHRYPLPRRPAVRSATCVNTAAALAHLRLAAPPRPASTSSTPATRPTCCSCVALPLQAARRTRSIFDQHDLVPELYLSRFGRGKDLLYRAVLALERLTYALADVVIATNETYRESRSSAGARSPEDVFVVRNGPDLARFGRRRAGSRAQARQARTSSAYSGVMGPQDGVDYALRALAALRDDGRDDWHAIFIGAGDASTTCARSRASSARRLVEFTGRIPDEDVRGSSRPPTCASRPIRRTRSTTSRR